MSLRWNEPSLNIPFETPNPLKTLNFSPMGLLGKSPSPLNEVSIRQSEFRSGFLISEEGFSTNPVRFFSGGFQANRQNKALILIKSVEIVHFQH